MGAGRSQPEARGRVGPQDPRLELRPAHGRGLGVFATKRLKSGDLVHTEAPLVCMPSADCELLRKEVDVFRVTGYEKPELRSRCQELISELDEAAAADFWSLEDAFRTEFDEKTPSGVFFTNAMPLDTRSDNKDRVEETDELPVLAVFARASRFNHSCVPNIHCSWHAEHGKLFIHVLREVKANEELCLCYSGDCLVLPADQRRALLNKWRFTCWCESCALTGQSRSTSDSHRRVMLRLKRELALRAGPAEEPQSHARAIAEAQERIRQQPMVAFEAVMQLSAHIDTELKGHAAQNRQAYSLAHELAQQLGDQELIVQSAEWALRESQLAEGWSERTKRLKEQQARSLAASAAPGLAPLEAASSTALLEEQGSAGHEQQDRRPGVSPAPPRAEDKVPLTAVPEPSIASEEAPG